MRNIWKTTPDSLTITIKNEWFHSTVFRGGYALQNVNFIKLKMADLQPSLTSTYVIDMANCAR